MIAVDNVHKWYGRLHALRGVSFELRPGQVAGLLGPNGAGKSTTIRILAGIMPPDTGHASIDGHDTLADSGPARASLGYLPESAPLYPEMTVMGYLRFRAALYRVGRGRRTATIEHAIERCWLGDVRSRQIGHLSKGYRQRVALAAAILHNPKALILDEPTNGLDPTQIAQMRGLVRELGSDRTMLISSHILPEIEQICSRILIVAGGELRADGSAAELIERHGEMPRVIVEARASVEGLRTALEPVVPRSDGASIDRVIVLRTIDDGWTRAEVRWAAAGADPREAIATVLTRAQIPLRELRVARSSIEDVFMSLTTGAAGSEAA